MKIPIFYQNIQNKINGPTGIWTRGLCLARAALSQSELRAHKQNRWFSVWLLYKQHNFLYKSLLTTHKNSITKILKLNVNNLTNIKSIRRWSSRRFPYGYLVTTSPSSKNRDSNTTKLQPSIRTTTRFKRLPPPLGVGTHCPSHCSPRVAQEIRGIRTYRRPLLPPVYHWRSP